MGGRGNNRNKSNNFYNSSNNGGRNAPYDNRSQPAHTSQQPSNYSLGRGNGNFQSRPYWPNPFTNTVGYRQPSPWVHQNSNNNPQRSRNNYRPQHPQSWEQTQQHRFPNQQNNSWNAGAPTPLLPPPMAPPNSTFRFDQVPVGTSSIPPPPRMFPIPNSSPNIAASTGNLAPTKGSSTSSAITPPLGSKEDRELRLEEAKTLLKRSLQESKGEEFCKSTPPTNSSSSLPSIGQIKKNCLKSKPTKPSEGDGDNVISLNVDRVIDNKSYKTSSSVPGSDDQRKRRLSLESNCVLSPEASKSTTKPMTPKRNRSNSLSVSVPKNPEVSAPSDSGNIKQRIIHELLGMSKNTLKEIISNPRSRKFEHVMKYMMKESRWKQSQIQRQVAQAGIDSPFESQNSELVQRDYEDLLSDPDLAINLSNLPSEMIETLGNIFNLGAVSGELHDASGDINLDPEEIACLFDSHSPSYVKPIPSIDLSSPSSECKDTIAGKEDQKTSEDCAIPFTHIVQDLKFDKFSNVVVMDLMETGDSSPVRKPHEPTLDSDRNKSITLSPLADGSKTLIPSDDSFGLEGKNAENMSPPRSPVTDNIPIPFSQEEQESIKETETKEQNDLQDVLDNQNVPLEEEDCVRPSTVASDAGNKTDKDAKLRTPSVEDELSLTNKDPMFSTQSDSPTIDEELASSSSRIKKDSENSMDTEDRDNNQLETNEPLLSPDPFNAVNINNNDMMEMKTIETVEPEESKVEASEEVDQCTLPAHPVKSEDCESTSTPQNLEFVASESLDVTSINSNSKDDPTSCVVGTLQVKSISQLNQVDVLETTENDSVSILLSSSVEHLKVAEVLKDEDTPMEIQEPINSPKTISGIEIGIQTDATAEDARCSVDANDMESILKLLEKSSLPEIDRVKKLLDESSSTPSVFTDKNCSLSTVNPENLGKIISEAAGGLDLFQSSLLTQSTNPTSPAATTLRTTRAAISIPPMIQPARARTNKHSKSKRQRPGAETDSDRLSTAEGTLKNLQNQIKGLEPKDKLKYVFLKITDIEKKIAEWADVKKELYQLVSYILEDEKSQSASSSHEESVTNEVEPESNKNSKSLSAKISLPSRSQVRPSRSNDSRISVRVESSSEYGSTSTSPSKNAPRGKRKKFLLTARKKSKTVNRNAPNPVLSAERNAVVTPADIPSKPTRSLARIKIESLSDNEDNPAICSSPVERSRSSKRNQPSASALSSPSPGPSKKRACTRQSSSHNATPPTQTNTSSPLRKTKAELKQMVFFPKPPEKITRQASVLKSLGEDVELRVTRRGRSAGVKEEITECETELNETEVTQSSHSVPLRNCSVVLQPLEAMPSKQNVTADESAAESQSVTSSEDDDELPLSMLNRKRNVSSPTASLQGDIDMSSVSSSDTISLKINIACPKSKKNKIKKYEEQPDGSRHSHHHSSKHGPLVFAQHNHGSILDIKVVGKHVLAAGQDGVVLSYSVKSGKLKKKYRGHSAAVTCICIINCESEPYYPEKMVTGSTDGQVRCFILKTAEQTHAPLQVGETTAIDSDWGVIYLGTKGGEIVQVNSKTFTNIGETFQCSKEPIHALIATKEGPRKVLIVGSRNQAITVRDAETGLLLRSVSGGWQRTVYSLLLDNSLVYCGTKEGNVPAFDFTNGQQMFSLQAGNGVRCLKAYNGLLFAGCYDGFIYVFQGQTLVAKFAGGKMIISMDFTKNKVIFSSKDMLQALNFPYEVGVLLKEMKMKRLQ